MFQVLPLGLSTACYVFTKLLRPLVQRWRASGLRVILYNIDNGFCVADSMRRPPWLYVLRQDWS